MKTEFVVAEQNLESLEKAVAKLNRKATKLKCDPIILAIGTSFFDEVLVFSDIKNDYEPIRIKFFNATIEGTAPTYRGWKLIGRLNHLHDDNGVEHTIVKTIEEVPKRFHKATNHTCDHCGVKRLRNDTFIVKNEKGKYMQVGRSCMKDFLDGHADPSALTLHAAHIMDLIDELTIDGGEVPKQVGVKHQRFIYFPVIEFLTETALTIQQYGRYISARQGMETGLKPTGTTVMDSLFNNEPVVFDANFVNAREQAIIAIDWIKGIDTSVDKYNTDYFHNLKTIVEMDGVCGRTTHYAASILPAYQKYLKTLKNEAERNTQPISEYIGTVGDRITIGVDVLRVQQFESNWGYVAMHRLRDSSGNVIIWYAKGSTVLEEGKNYQIAGTIKKHDEYKGIKQTVLTRVREV